MKFKVQILYHNFKNCVFLCLNQRIFKVVLLFSYQASYFAVLSFANSSFILSLSFLLVKNFFNSFRDLFSVTTYSCYHTHSTLSSIIFIFSSIIISQSFLRKNNTEKEGFEPSHRANDLHP